MRFYGYTYREVQKLPIRNFWWLLKLIDRVTAEEDLRSLDIMTAAMGGDKDSILRFRQELSERVGTIVSGVMPVAELDREGLNDLKGLSLQQKMRSKR